MRLTNARQVIIVLSVFIHHIHDWTEPNDDLLQLAKNYCAISDTKQFLDLITVACMELIIVVSAELISVLEH